MVVPEIEVEVRDTRGRMSKQRHDGASATMPVALHVNVATTPQRICDGQGRVRVPNRNRRHWLEGDEGT